MTSPRPYLNQGDPAWGKLKAGRSRTATIQQVGCVLTCLAQAQRQMRINATATPVTVQTRALEAWDGRAETAPFSGNTAAAFMARIGAANDLIIDDRVNVIEGAVFWQTLMRVFDSAGLVMLHVDSRDDGLDEPNHWVLGIRFEKAADGRELELVYADPDGGMEGRFKLADLRALSPRGKPYHVRGMRRLRPARASG